MTNEIHRRVIKIGGGLFDFADLGSRLRQLLESMTDSQNTLLCGCGVLADQIREMQNCHGWSDEACHWHCLRLMSLTVRFVEEWIEPIDIVTCLTEIEVRSHGNVGFDCGQWVTVRDALERSWRLTSDSIAAALAIELDAELVLIKSSAPISGHVGELVADGYLDQCFNEYAARLRSLSIVDLRNGGQFDVSR